MITQDKKEEMKQKTAEMSEKEIQNVDSVAKNSSIKVEQKNEE